jgi:hypothetical protein
MRDAALKKSERYMRLHGLSNDPDLREKYLRTAPARLALRRARAGVRIPMKSPGHSEMMSPGIPT